ncbi:LUD domain-containing protein [uncultured Bacteroides sp.]|uniref:LutC/YkgG family protein n=1 Tax=uncultured Bacteroides sp. TaxID=162156 RepID=UPI0025F8087F|nr:LUD domain-containing protein [uncultured Bacteroides sp.]
MNSKEEILASIRRHTSKRYEKPDVATLQSLSYADKIAQFCAVSRAVGGAAVVLGEGEDVNAVIRNAFPDAVRIASVLPQISCATFNPDHLDDPRQLDGTDVAVVKGEIGVAENGAVWVPQATKHKALCFISETLVILLDRNRIVDTMHEAYRKLDGQHYEFGTFISGPSKTADIEQALVMGAHGARGVLIVLI